MTSEFLEEKRIFDIRCGCNLQVKKDVFGDEEIKTVPCEDHRPIIDKLQNIQSEIKSMQNLLLGFNLWCQEICRFRDFYEDESYKFLCSEIRDSMKQLESKLVE